MTILEGCRLGNFNLMPPALSRPEHCILFDPSWTHFVLAERCGGLQASAAAARPWPSAMLREATLRRHDCHNSSYS